MEKSSSAPIVAPNSRSTRSDVVIGRHYRHPVPARQGSGRLGATPIEEAQAMKAVIWHGKRDVRVDSVPDPAIRRPTDAIVRITSTGICGSDLHLYEVMGPFMGEGDVLGHEPMGI